MALTPETLVNKSLKLVSPPNTYAQLDALIKDPNSSAEDISDVINTDLALVTRLLKVVNSPFYGFPSQINTISRAITIIGTRELTHLVLATSVIDAFKGIPSSLINMTEFWRHSLACAIAAKYLAKECGQRATERYFISGLLQNIGSLVIYQSVPELAREVINSAKFGNEVIYKAEQRILGFDHTDVGQALVKAWRLPHSLEEVVKCHHTPSQSVNFPLEVAVVHIADIIVSSAQLGHSGDSHVPPLDPDAWDLLGLDEKIIPDLVKELVQQLDELANLLT
ncbi:MAG: HDOD domain-containing protein [Proteobacteria bacterium]|nr:HDOD domain-containing protein [Pseudomonadota bacterium]